MHTPISQLGITHPLWLLIIPFALLLLAWLLWRNPRCLLPFASLLHGLGVRRYRHPQYSVLQALQQEKQSRAMKRRWLAQFLSYAVLLTLFCLALAQPYRLGARLPAPQQHRDIIFIVDTSLNMTLRDYVVNGQRMSRMTMLKQVLQQFVSALHGNRIGLVVFSEQPYDYVPLTNDYGLLQYQIRRLRAAVLTGRTSNISRALLYSLRQVKQDEQSSPGARPVLVLISDANRSARHIDPRAAAAYLARQHLRLHTIAIGAGSYAGAEKHRLTLIYHPASFYLLQGIARAGDGKFFWAKDEASLQQALRAINAASLRATTAAPQYVRQPLYMWPLLLALIWLSLWQLLPLLRRRR
ncbi:MAG: VWA domain-containing protein [Gammaproteobacteria bacterium]|jgi:Ca-activated chloride channel homolog